MASTLVGGALGAVAGLTATRPGRWGRRLPSDRRSRPGCASRPRRCSARCSTARCVCPGASPISSPR